MFVSCWSLPSSPCLCEWEVLKVWMVCGVEQVPTPGDQESCCVSRCHETGQVTSHAEARFPGHRES